MTRLTPHFTLEEFTASDTAARLGLANTVPAELLPNALHTCAMLELIRKHLSMLAKRDIPVQITSGYRCPQLNAAIGSKPSSDHVQALAADIRAPDFGSAYQVSHALAPVAHILGIGQVIYEFGAWTHVGAKTPAKDINRVLTISKAGTVPGIVEVA